MGKIRNGRGKNGDRVERGAKHKKKRGAQGAAKRHGGTVPKLQSFARADGPTDRRAAKAAAKLAKEKGGGPIEKGRYEKVEGTRIQALRGGAAVRVVIEDGKKFEPENVRGARLHMAKLERKAQEAAEVARIRGEEVKDRPVLVKKTVKKGTAVKGDAKTDVSAKVSRAEEKRRKSAERYSAAHERDGRMLVAACDWCTGEVVERAKGRAWVRLTSPAESIPANVLQRLREGNAELRAAAMVGAETGAAFCSGATGDLVPVAFADVTDKSLQLQTGVALRFKLYTDTHKVGGCDAVAA
eukprot:gnl/TRDRNA2_/TRDRNA2_38253_c0_seq1.p1 gnl/TRDRNA2_/TRDRNA2_38253_c0~~gnl/TRDRNA2_/TRDRNA2_38253_c0_seq1.p1  ORF type:complete len:298 (-),score=56.71 gnl/TRDRNA2_/TRDRNA2_38253_c0_seq1:36-929(-)